MLAALVVLAAGACGALDPRLAGVRDALYLLQIGSAPISDIAATQFDLIITDYSRDGGEAERLTTTDVAALRSSGKLALAYLSIGEAEDYRYYWNPAWESSPPPWLGPANPGWPGNYKVRYWDPQWQAIVCGGAGGADESYLDRIVGQGFDGVYLDIVDAYEFWSSRPGRNELTRPEARRAMLDFILRIRNYARVTRGKPDFLVFPQNAREIILDDEGNLDTIGQAYLDAIDGIGNEDIWYNGTKRQRRSSTAQTLGLLETYRTNGGGRLVIGTDYVWDPRRPARRANVARYNDFKSRAEAAGIVSYAAAKDRALDRIVTVDPVGGFLYPQPAPPNLQAP